jgi:hypothetical protein
MRRGWHAPSMQSRAGTSVTLASKASHSESISGEQVTLAASEQASNQSKRRPRAATLGSGCPWVKHDSARRQLPEQAAGAKVTPRRTNIAKATLP